MVVEVPQASEEGRTEEIVQLDVVGQQTKDNDQPCHKGCKCNSRVKRCQLALDVSILTMFILSLIMVIIITVQSGYLSASVPSQVKQLNSGVQEIQARLDDMNEILLFISEVILQQQRPEMKVYQHVPYVGQSD